MACDLLLAAFSKQIHSKTRVHTQGLSPGYTRTYPGTVPKFTGKDGSGSIPLQHRHDWRKLWQSCSEFQGGVGGCEL